MILSNVNEGAAMINNRVMQIGELSRKSGISRHTIHYYIKKGILHPPEKAGKTRAYFDLSHLERLRVIKGIKRDFNSPLAFILSQFDQSAGADESKSPVALPFENDTGEEKKQRIIEASIELFSTKGYYHTSVKDITDFLGYSTGTFYIYFKSKRELFHQVVTKGIKSIADEVENIAQKEEDFFLRNTLRLEALSEHYLKFNEILTQLRLEILDRENPDRKSLEKVYFELTRPFIREIRQAFELGLIRSVEPDLLTFCLMGMCDMLLFRKSLDEQYDLNQIIAFIFDVMLNGLRRNQDVSSADQADNSVEGLSVLTEEEKEFLDGLRRVRYNQSGYARVIGKSRQSVSNYLRRHPHLKEIIEEEKAAVN